MLKLSIIIPVYNVEKYLNKCLDSIFSQNSDKIEVICVDDGSTDKSLQMLNEYKEKYSNLIVISQKNGGTAVARNTGIKHAKGEYIGFIDSDDWIVEGSISLLLEKLENFNNDILCFNGKLKYEETGEEKEEEGITETHLTGWDYYNKYALQSRHFHFVCVVLRLYKRQFLLDNSLFFEVGIAHEDNLWIPQVMYYAKSVSVIPITLYVYRIRSGSKMRTITFNKLVDVINTANHLSTFFIPKTDVDKSVVYREIAGEYFSVFMPDKTKIYGKSEMKKLRKLLIWENYKKVSIYPRHKRIYHLLKISPTLFHWYLKLEKRVKNG